MSQLAANGGQPQKAPRYAPIYQGRFFNGINTNRSPLRAASASHIAEKFYSDNSGDAMIAGSNIEVSNRLTLVRRPGNPIFDQTHQYNDPDAFDEFRVNKAQSDVFGTTLESIFTMVDESGNQNLYSLDQAFNRGGDIGYYYGLKFQKASGAGQSFMQAVGNSLYFANGVQNKKWLTSLFVRNSVDSDNTYLAGADGLGGTYPVGTYLIDPATGNIQEFIGVSIGRVSSVTVSDNVITLTVGTLTVPPSTPANIPIGTSFQLWGFTATNNTWLNGATITLTAPYTYGVSMALVADLEHHNYTAAESGQSFIIQAGTTPYIAKTGGSVPTWGTTLPSASNLFMGSLTEDGNTVWINRGVNYGDGEQPSVMNWGIKAPTIAPSYEATGSAISWQKGTYYSPASVYIDPTHGNLWQITTAGVTGATQPSWPSGPTHQQKVVILSAYADGTNIYFTTSTQLPALASGDTVVLQNMCALGTNIGGQPTLPNLNGVSLTVSATGLTTTEFQAPYTTNTFGSSGTPIQEYGQALKTNTATTVADGAAVWTCIQLAASLTWTAHTHYNVGDFLVANSSIFQLGPQVQPFVRGSITTQAWPKNHAFAGAFDKSYPAGTGSITLPTVAGLHWVGDASGLPQNTQMFAINGAGEVGSSTDSGQFENWEAAIYCSIFIPAPGTYVFTLAHDDGAYFSFDTSTGATLLSGTGHNIPPSFGTTGTTAVKGYTGCVGNNVSNANTDSAQWSFPSAGVYEVEIDWCNWQGQSCMIFSCPGPATMYTITTGGQDVGIGINESGTNAPTFPAFTTTGANYNLTSGLIEWGASVVEVQNGAQQYTWNNLGPVSDYVWTASTFYTLPGTLIIDSNGNQQAPYETGISGATAPAWQSTVGAITKDNPNLQWICEGSVPAQTQTGNTITALSQQGWLYWIALVNTLDQTVSNVGPVSLPTGPIDKGQVTFAPGSGLPTNLADIDPQADYVAIFRSTDGFSTPLLIPGFVNSPYTVPLTQYLRNGYVDEVPDAELNNLEQGAQAGENTPPAIGAKNLTYHLSRIWYSIGDTVYYTTGPLAPIGNGTDGTAPGNFATCSSQIRRLVPTAIGMLVFTVSDIYIIAGNGTATSPILPAIPYLTGIGLANYNALDINGGLIGFFTTDKQFVIFDPSAGLSYVGFNIGDQFRLNNGLPGTSWNPSLVYVSWYTNGEDQAWFVGDGVNGWYKCIATPAPEQGSVAWSPFATIVGGAGAIKSVETAPGVHNLLVGQTTSTSNLLYRSLSATTDNGTTHSNGSAYSAYGVIGSIVLAQPGQIAKIAFITTDSVNVGSPLILGVILDEALPYYTGSFDILKDWKTDPTNMPQSTSILSQRFYLAENTEDSAYCKHLQILCQWPPEAAMNELVAITVFGCYEIEQ